MKKIAFIGAGSYNFTRCIVRDLMTFPIFKDATIALMDVDEERLSYSTRAVENIVAKSENCTAKVISTTSRQEALQDADGVLITVLPHDHHIFERDLRIPMKYGVDINVGDTRGPAAIFRLLRAAPVLLDIAKDIKTYAPNALVLNYTNPMAMICSLFQKAYGLNVTGLCHSVQGTASMLAGWIGADPKDVTYLCAGINHQAFYLEFKVKGKDAYPRIMEAINGPHYGDELVRNEMCRHLGYYSTESSGHASEYIPWFRKRPDLMEKYCSSGIGNYGEHNYTITFRNEREKRWRQEILDDLAKPQIDLKRGFEYAAYIFDAYFGGEASFYEFNGNVPNTNLIPNLPYGSCVEVPVLVTKGKIRPMYVGNLPEQLAILINTNARCEDLAVAGILEGDREKIFHAILMDPLTGAVCSMQETKDMVDEMFRENEEYLGYFKK